MEAMMDMAIEVITAYWQIEQRGKRWVVVEYSHDGPKDVSRPLSYNAARRLQKRRRCEDYLRWRIPNIKGDVVRRIIREMLKQVPAVDWRYVREYEYIARYRSRAESDTQQESNVIMFPTPLPAH
jgi:hypothetical protein